VPLLESVRDLGRDEDGMQRVVEAARDGLLTDDDIAALATVLAQSGAQLPRDESAADVASTGGISSLSTLICPLQLRARGRSVPKLGVAGRQAGGVDVLQTVPGYNANLDPREAREALARFGYVHLLADERWAPLDARLFAFRQASGTQAEPALVIASLLAKKMAAGTVGAGLEVRVAEHGNFGGDFESARANGRRYLAVAQLLGLRGACVLTDASAPYQPYIGRGEALVALWRVLTGTSDGWLADHVQLCERITAAVTGSVEDGLRPAANLALREAHSQLLEAHGSSWPAFEARAEQVLAARVTDTFAPAAGVVNYDLARLRSLLVQRQREGAVVGSGRPADPAGVVLHARPGGLVDASERLMSVRAEGDEEFVRLVASCAEIDTIGESSEPTWDRAEVL